ncbi:MAG: acyl-CoA desaturase, partial [Marinobacter sp.]
YTNIIGKDRDYGYALLRLSDDDKWKPAHSLQLINYILLSVFFQWGVGLHELESERIRRREISVREKIPFLKDFFRKGGRQAFKDYVFFPLITFPVAPVVLAGNIGANLIRNLWSSTVIFCGHFTQDAETFTEEECEGESKGHWYLRQLTGSSNFTGSKWVHLLSGHLSYQIEHHVFPDLPAHRYPEMSEKVQAVCKKHGIPYNTGTFAKQYSTVLKRIFGYSLPDRMRNRLLPEFSNRALG